MHFQTKARDPEDRQIDERNPCEKKEKMLDKTVADTFPASDPPSYSGGNHIIGAPTGRESDAPTADHPAVIDAEKKAKEKSAKK